MGSDKKKGQKSSKVQPRKIDFQSKKSGVLRPKVFDYTNTTELMGDWVHYLRKLDSDLNLVKLSSRLGVAVSYLSMLLSGERRLTKKAFSRMKGHLSFDDSEEKYIELLCEFEGANNLKRKDEVFKKVQKLEAYISNRPEETATYGYFSNWINVVVHKIVQQENFKDDLEWIQSQIDHKVTKKQIKDALEFLLDRGLVLKSEDGTYSTAVDSIKCEDQVFKMAMINYHQMMLGLASESLETMSGRENRYVIGGTVTVSQDQYVEICRILENARSQAMSVESKRSSEQNRVIQIELSAFSLATKKSGVKNDD